MRVLFCIIAASFAVACDPGDGETQAPTAAAGDCTALAGLAKDSCLADEIALVPADQASVVAEKAVQIDDMMVRGACVSKWVGDNVASLRQADGKQLCDLLSGRDQSYCMRRLSSPHLQR